MTTEPDSSKQPKKPTPGDAITPERPEEDPNQPGGCDATPGGRGDASGKPACPEGYPEEQQTDDAGKRPAKSGQSPSQSPDQSPSRSPGQTPGRNTPDQRERG
jgi:hypothetical protein